MSWTDPRWLWVATGAVCLLPAAAAVARWRSRQQARLAGGRLWSRWLGGVPATGGGRLALWLLAAAAAAVAAAGPRWGHGDEAPELAVAVALDVSASMRCADVRPDRLGRAEAVLREAIGRTGPASWALATGAGAARARVPLTADPRAVEDALADSGLERGLPGGSNLAVLLSAAAALLEPAGSGRAVVVVSDGEELEGDAAGVAVALRRSGTAVVALAAGSVAGGPVPRTGAGGALAYLRDGNGAMVRSHAHPELLRRLCADASDVVDASSATASRDLAAALRRAAAVTGGAAAPARSRPFGLAAALLATASFLLWPWRRRAFAAALLLPGIVGAGPLPPPTPSFLQRALPGAADLAARRAVAAMRRGAWGEASRAYAEALALSPDDDDLRLGWATAAALAGDDGGDEALARLAALPGSGRQALYNLGTVRLLRGDAADAVDALRRAVTLDPGREEGWHNLELALASGRRAGGGERSSGMSATGRARLVEAAARAALAPVPVKAPAPSGVAGAREW